MNRGGEVVVGKPGRMRAALPSWGVGVLGSLLWALAMASSAAVSLWMRGWESDFAIGEVALLFAVGAAVAFPLACWLAAFCGALRSFEARFAISFLAFASATIGLTSAIYAFDYRSYYAVWHDNVFTVTWFIQLAFTTAGALVQFAVSGVRLYFPIGFIALLAASLWFARLPR